MGSCVRLLGVLSSRAAGGFLCEAAGGFLCGANGRFLRDSCLRLLGLYT